MELRFRPSKVRISSTAEKKELNISSCKISFCEWQHKRIELWTPVDTVNWVMSVAHVNELDCEEIHNFRKVDGHRLISMSKDKFIILEPSCGNALYRAMLILKSEQDFGKLDSPCDTIKMELPFLSENIQESNIPHKDDKLQETCDSLLCPSTAVYKQLNLPSYHISSCKWQQKRIHQWTPADTINWVISVARDNQLNCDEIHNFCDVDGNRLVSMDEVEFVKFEPNCGRALYRNMQIQCKQVQPRLKRTRCHLSRKKKTTKVKIGRLWEFIRDLLLNPEYCPSLVRWENYNEGIFRFVDSRKVARLWGTIKDNPKMTYEKFSRALRYYYRGRVFEPVLGQRLVYKFGPTAKGWQTLNPNFILEEK